MFHTLWRRALRRYDREFGLDWRWLAMDGAMSKAPLGGEKRGPNPTDRAKGGSKRSLLTDAAGVPLGLAIAGANRNDFKLFAETVTSVPVRRPGPGSRRRRGCVSTKGTTTRRCAPSPPPSASRCTCARGAKRLRPQATRRDQSAALGGRTLAQLDESIPPHPDSLGEESGELSGDAPFRVCDHHVARCGATGIGS